MKWTFGSIAIGICLIGCCGTQPSPPAKPALREVSVVDITVWPDPMFRTRTYEDLYAAMAAIKPGQRLIVHLRFGTRGAWSARIWSSLSVKQGALTVMSREGTFTVLPGSKVRVKNIHNDVNNLWSSGDQGVSLNVQFYYTASGTRGADIMVTEVESAAGTEADWERDCVQELPWSISEETMVATMEIQASDDFQGSLSPWYQIAGK